MLNEISDHIKQVINNFPTQDSLLFNNKEFKIDKGLFKELFSNDIINKKIAFIDGGQAEILSAGNFCLSFIRVAAVIFLGNKKQQQIVNEFYLFTKAVHKNNDLYYESKIFPVNEKLIDEQDLFISSNDASIKTGFERAPITKVSNMARRFAELCLAKQAATSSDFVLLDGSLDKTFNLEENYLQQLPNNVSALAKSSSLFTVSGNSPVILLNQLKSSGFWQYPVNERTSFVKMHDKAQHVFRFDGNSEMLSYLINNCADALFLGYPYGLIMADKVARVSNQEKQALFMQFLLRSENKEIADYLRSQNAHGILDRIS